MNPQNVMLVYGKELRDTLRDRRTIIWSIVFPVVVIPVLMFGMIGVASTLMGKAKAETVAVVLAGEEHAPELAARLEQIERFTFVDAPDDVDAAIGDKRIRAAIEIPPGFEAALAAGEQPKLTVRYHEGEFKSEAAVRDVQRVAGEYRQEILAERLAAYGLDERALEPFTVHRKNVASDEQVGAQAAGGLVPYVVILMCLVGAMFPAIDLTAGEKERGTMETILASSVGRVDLAVGKFLTVMTASLATVVLSLTSLGVTAVVLVPRFAGDTANNDLNEMVSMFTSLDPLGILGMLALIVPLTMLFSAVLLAVALFARSHREAQQYVGPLPMVVIVPAMIGLLPAIDLSWKTALIPVTSTSLAAKELLAGSFDWPLLALILGTSCAYALIAMAVVVKLFQREEVLFRT